MRGLSLFDSREWSFRAYRAWMIACASVALSLVIATDVEAQTLSRKDGVGMKAPASFKTIRSTSKTLTASNPKKRGTKSPRPAFLPPRQHFRIPLT
ncbi:MAG: hypothetical protein HC871_11935 [Rhizobiales bacterium]|nr:hypothetical protein [Hyphomicrobiales bacterium]